MGNWFCRTKKMKFVILGLDSCGKTTMLYRMKLGEIVSTIPTIGFNLETIHVDGVDINAWDMGSRDKIRPLWQVYFANTHGFVFMIDSTDRERLEEAIDLLVSYVIGSHDAENKIIMVIANKQDMEGAMSAQEIEDALPNWCRSNEIKSSVLLVVPCSALDGKQVTDIFSYLTRLMCLNETGKLKPGFISLKEQESQKSKANSAGTELVFKTFLKQPVQYLTSYLK